MGAATMTDAVATGDQLARLRGPRPRVPVVRACTPGDGIDPLTDLDGRLELAAGEAGQMGRVTLVIPAAGAATRLLGPVRELAEGEATALASDGPSLAIWPDGVRDPVTAARGLLEGYAGQPKGLIPFHDHGPGTQTATQAHLREAKALSARVHLVVSPAHRDAFEAHVADARTGVVVTTAVQSSATDTIALDDAGQVLRAPDGSVVRRPAGHGALLDVLSDLAGDILLLENIDNVSAPPWSAFVVPWRRRLVGAVVEAQARLHAALDRLDALGSRAIDDATGRLLHELGWPPTSHADQARTWLDRPLRVCGMVPLAGQPGGGPFWVAEDGGAVRRQIVEGVHLDLERPGQREAVAGSTHFNPVEVACAVRDRDGRPYDLAAFTDDSTWIVTDKSHDGRPIVALERPGLWNGAMAGWNTLFVALPSEVFTPVKTVYDLLHPSHSGQTPG